MKLCILAAIVLASIVTSSTSSRDARDTECDIENAAMLAPPGLDQACVESIDDMTKINVFCQQNCSKELVVAFEEQCSNCEYRKTASKRCYRFNSTYSCEQLLAKDFTSISFQELKATTNCFGEGINTTICSSALTALTSIMGCCFNAVYNTSFFGRDTLGFATFELWQTYDLAPFEGCLTPPFDSMCSVSNDITSSTTDGERGLKQTVLGSTFALLLATVLIHFH